MMDCVEVIGKCTCDALSFCRQTKFGAAFSTSSTIGRRLKESRQETSNQTKTPSEMRRRRRENFPFPEWSQNCNERVVIKCRNEGRRSLLPSTSRPAEFLLFAEMKKLAIKFKSSSQRGGREGKRTI